MALCRMIMLKHLQCTIPFSDKIFMNGKIYNVLHFPRNISATESLKFKNYFRKAIFDQEWIGGELFFIYDKFLANNFFSEKAIQGKIKTTLRSRIWSFCDALRFLTPQKKIIFLSKILWNDTLNATLQRVRLIFSGFMILFRITPLPAEWKKKPFLSTNFSKNYSDWPNILKCWSNKQIQDCFDATWLLTLLIMNYRSLIARLHFPNSIFGAMVHSMPVKRGRENASFRIDGMSLGHWVLAQIENCPVLVDPSHSKSGPHPVHFYPLLPTSNPLPVHFQSTWAP